MAAKRFTRNIGGTLSDIQATDTSAGAGNAGDLIALDATGKLDTSLLPVGIGADTASITTSEALAAGDFVNIHISSGFKVRKADASTTGKKAHGFVLAGVGSGGTAIVYRGGSNTQVSGVTTADVWLSTTVPGGFQTTAPNASGQTVQRLGVGTSATVINFQGAEEFFEIV